MILLIIFRLIRQVEECSERWNSTRLKPPAIFVYTDIAGFDLFHSDVAEDSIFLECEAM